MSMHAFQWAGINKQGKRVSGVIRVNELKDAERELKSKHIEITSIKQKKGFNISFGMKKIKREEVLLFTRYLSTMIAAGLPILQALEIVGKDQANPAMQNFVNTLKGNTAGGKTLSESFALFPQYFNGLYCNLIKAGEKSGTLDKILVRLAAYLERSENLRRKVKKAMIYPAAILTVALGVSLVLLLFVVPQFEKIFQSFGAKLPTFTLLVIGFSNFLRSYWWLGLIVIVGSVWWIRLLNQKSDKFRYFVDKASLRIPLIGPMLQKSIIARFARTLSITMEAGMPIIESMRSMSDLMGNILYKDALAKICDEVASGVQLNIAMQNTKLFPNMVIQMVAIGEASGSLSAMLAKVADYYEEDVNSIVDNLSSLLEPLIMAILGVIVGGFVIAMYLPIFKLGSLV